MRNEQLTGNREQVAVNREKRKAFFCFPRSSFAHCSLLSATCYLFTVSCELFSGSEIDLLAKIDEEVAWANADKLTVRVEYLSAWGVSNPTGTITPAKDIRKGYAFEIEFTPELEYSLDGWRAYATSSLNALGGNWTLDPGLLDGLERLDGEGGTVIVPVLPARGGTGSFTINTTEAVTLVPWCKTEPYVTRTVPRNSPQTLYPLDTKIVIYFNAPLALAAGEVDLFETGAITITGDTGNGPDVISNDYDTYNKPVYSEERGEYTITIDPSNVPGDCIIEVTVGPDIRNLDNVPMARAEVFSFGTNAGTATGGIKNDWSASYTGSSITVNWNMTEDTSPGVEVKGRYRINSGGDNDFNSSVSSLAYTGTISSVSGIDGSGVREGRSVSNIREYEIFLDLYMEGVRSNAGSVSFKIWNIPGMTVNIANATNTVSLTQANFTTIDFTAYTNYVLTEAITLNNWTPVNLSGKNFYGNGHTVTVNGMNAANDSGLFGTVTGGMIRDLTVVHNTVISRGGRTLFGGIAGEVTGNAQLENVLVRGSASVTVTGANDMYAGGIAGLMSGTASIKNAYSGLNLTAVHPDDTTSVYVGGIAGSMGVPGTGDAVKVEQAIATGDIEVNASAWNESNSLYGLYTGGVAGMVHGTDSARAEISNSQYRQGNITVISGKGCAYTGGFAGKVLYADLNGCSAIAKSFDVSKTGSGNMFYTGGFLGDFMRSGTITGCYGENPVTVSRDDGSVVAGGFAGRIGYLSSYPGSVSYCYAVGDVSASGKGDIYVGGFTGLILNGWTASYCYAAGNVSLTSTGGDATAGGFAGSAYGVYDCYALGDVFVNHDDPSGTANVYTGGLIGQARGSASPVAEYVGKFYHNFAKGAVVAQRNGSRGSFYTGGLFGLCTTGTVTENAAPGTGVTVTGSTTGTIGRGRVYGYRSSGTTNNNYAWNGMGLYYSDVYGNGRPPEDTSITDATKVLDGKDGADAHAGLLRTVGFWRDTLHFDSAHWDFSTVTGKGYPVLRGPDGKVLGGQQ